MRDTKNIIRNGKATKMDERSHVSRDNEHQSLLKLHGHVITQKCTMARLHWQFLLRFRARFQIVGVNYWRFKTPRNRQ